MTTAHVSSAGNYKSYNGSGDYNIGFTVPGGLTNSILIFAVNFWNSDSRNDPGVCKAFQWAGNGLTMLYSNQTSSGYNRFNIGYMLNPTAGTYNGFAQATRACEAKGVISVFSGVNQGSPIASTTDYVGLTNTMSTIAGQVVYDVISVGQQYDLASAQGSMVNTANATGAGAGISSGYAVATSTSTACSWYTAYNWLWHRSIVLNWDTAPIPPVTFKPFATIF